MITGEYILDVVVYHEETKDAIGRGNVFLNKVSVETPLEFYKLAKTTIKKDFGNDATIRIVGVFKL